MGKSAENPAVKLKIGDRVKWTGKANGSEKEHEGIVMKLPSPHESGGNLTATVEIRSKNPRTGKDNKPKRYTPRLSALTPVK